MPVRKSNPRGQAIVESVLGILVFISVLMFGLHFADVTFTQMKVTEAAQSAVWDSTAGQMHILPDIAGNLFGNF
ncbi:MAG: putative pilus biosis operon protein, partial [Myxococcaceae bacterium]|nr:putative pilus biosis operon protein [Myxococcaceae bacterium]